jgi:neopullulanase
MRFLLAIAVCAVAALPVAPVVEVRAGAPPVVVGVDPPSWFVDHSMADIQLLVHGSGLLGAELVSDDVQVAVVESRPNAAGTYLVADVAIAPDASAGPVGLRLVKNGQSSPVAFSLETRRSRQGRFSGLDRDDVVYLVMPDRFANGDAANDETLGPGTTHDRANPNYYHGGDLRGLTEKLPYLADLGVTAVWLNPIYENVDEAGAFQPYHGYHATDYYDVDNHLGTVDAFADLVDAAHSVGLKVVQDQVANHTSPNHPWVASYPTPTWYNGTPADHLTNPFDIPSVVNERGDSAARRATLEGWFIDLLPDLNQNDSDLARYEIQNTLWWIETTGIDAIRQDTLPYVPRAFWRTWMTAVKSEYPNFTVVGEVFHGDPAMTSFFQGGATRYDGVDSMVDTVFDFPLFFALSDVLAGGRDASGIVRVLNADAGYPDASVLVPFIGNHDTPRFVRTAGGSVKRLMLAQTVLLTMRGIPQMYYGDEIGLDGGGDPDNRRDFPGGFPGDPRDAFTREGRSKAQNKVFDHVRRLLALRASEPALRGPVVRPFFVGSTAVAYLRDNDGAKALVVLNASTAQQTIRPMVAPFVPDGTRLRDALKGKVKSKVKGGVASVTLPGLAAVILLPE